MFVRTIVGYVNTSLYFSPLQNSFELDSAAVMPSLTVEHVFIHDCTQHYSEGRLP